MHASVKHVRLNPPDTASHIVLSNLTLIVFVTWHDTQSCRTRLFPCPVSAPVNKALRASSWCSAKVRCSTTTSC